MSTLASYRTRERTLPLPDGTSVLVLEVSDVDALLDDAIDEGSPPPYGAVLWASGVALARRLLARGSLAGLRVVDVGAGVGLCSLVAARLGAEVIALDHDPISRALLTEAAARQGLTVDARDFDLYGTEPVPPSDLVIFADLLYETPLARAAARRVAEVVRRGSEVLVGDPDRIGRPDFLRDLEEHGVTAAFDTVVVDVPGDERPQKVGVLALPGATS